MIGNNCFPDTNIIIALLNGEDNLASKLDLYDTIYLSSIVLGELYYGAYGSANKAKNLDRIKKFIERSTLIFPDESTSAMYGQIKANLKKKGRPIPENDVWIAALAVQHKTVLATRDGHFKEVTNLKTVKW